MLNFWPGASVARPPGRGRGQGGAVPIGSERRRAGCAGKGGTVRKNRLRERWAEGRKTVNGWLAVPSAFSAELMAHQGWDSLTVDMQHGIVDYQAAVTMLQAISTTGAVPMVRVPWREPGIVMKMLDAGAYGIVCPMVNDRREAEELVSFGRYAPAGRRSFGPIRAQLYGGADYPRHANEEILLIAMIETAEALANLDEILAVEGLDAVYVGPADLALSLGCTPGFDPTEPRVLDAIGEILDKAKAHGRFAGIHCGSPDFARRMWARGFDFVTLLSDARLMAMKAGEVLNAVRADEGNGEAGGGSY